MENTQSIEIVKPLNLYQKLLEIQRKINGLGKDKDTKTSNNPSGYKYVTGDKVLSHIKPLMNEYGLILKTEIISLINVRQDYKTKYGEKAEILTTIELRFTWVDCQTGDKDVNIFFANGQNDWEKGLGSALTYGERYFFLKFFHIATDEDDIDNPDRKTSEPVQQKAVPTLPPFVQKEKDILVQNSANWHDVIEAMTNGKNGKVYTLNEVEKKYTIPEKTKESLLEIVSAKELA